MVGGGAEDPVVGDGALALGVDRHVPAAAARLFAQRRLDAARRLGRDAGDDRPVDLLDLALREQPAEAAQRFRVAAEDKAPRSVAVEPVGQGRRPRQAEAQQRQPVFEMRPAGRPGMHRDAGRLVDHQHQPVAIQHPVGKVHHPNIVVAPGGRKR